MENQYDWRCRWRARLRTAQKDTNKSRPHPYCALCLSHSLTNWPSSSSWVPSAVHLILAISRKPRRAQLIELGGWVGGLLPARRFLSFVHPVLLPCSQTSDSVRTALTQECVWMHTDGGVTWDSAAKKTGFMVEIQTVILLYLLRTLKLLFEFFMWLGGYCFFLFKDHSSSVLNMQSCFFLEKCFVWSKIAFQHLRKIFVKAQFRLMVLAWTE